MTPVQNDELMRNFRAVQSSVKALPAWKEHIIFAYKNSVRLRRVLRHLLFAQDR